MTRSICLQAIIYIENNLSITMNIHEQQKEVKYESSIQALLIRNTKTQKKKQKKKKTLTFMNHKQQKL